MKNSAHEMEISFDLDMVGADGNNDDLEPYAALFLKPLTSRKSAFSDKDLETMCKDPLHSPRLILYLIDRVKGM